MAPDLNAIGIRATYSFETLVVGPNNQVAAAACQAVAKAPGETYNPLFLYGPAGVGKTHLMQAVAHALLQLRPDIKIKYISAERFMNDVVLAVSEDRLPQLRAVYNALDLLIVDDVQYLMESRISQEELFHIFNNMHQQNRQVILASDRPPNQLTSLSKNVRTRLEWGLSADVQVPDVSVRFEILKRKQAAQGFELTDEMLSYVAQMLRSNVRELEGFLKRMHAYVTLSHQTISMSLVQSVVREILPEGQQPDDPPEPVPRKNGTHKNGAAIENVRTITPLDQLGQSDAPEPPAPPPPAPAAPTQMPAAAAFAPPPAPPRPQTPSSIEKNFPPPPSLGIQTPAKPPPSAPSQPAPVMEVPDAPMMNEGEEEGMPSGHKEVSAVFFFPAGSEPALENVSQKFQEVIKKHKLKFRLKRVHSHGYETKGKINYASFVDVCKANKVPVAIVIGPPPDAILQEQDFYDLLSVTLDVQGVSLQLVNWSEINKDYRYLNLALDIALVRSR